jgi:hypothetical protein
MKPPISKPIPIPVVTYSYRSSYGSNTCTYWENLDDDKLLGGRLGVNIILEKLKATLGLPKP